MAARRRGPSKLIKLLIAVALIGAIAICGYRYYSGSVGGSKAESVLTSLERLIPGLGEDQDMARGMGRDPLASVTIDGIDIVGVLEIPSLDVTAPVMAKDHDEEESFTKWLDGSPVQGHFKILGGRNDIFRKIADLKPGDRVFFTDVDGVRYGYEVRTQYHLKKWDQGDNELQLCYETDKDTFFVVGCSMTMSE